MCTVCCNINHLTPSLTPSFTPDNFTFYPQSAFLGFSINLRTKVISLNNARLLLRLHPAKLEVQFSRSPAFQHAVRTSCLPFNTQSVLPVGLSTRSPHFLFAFQHAVRTSSWPFSTQSVLPVGLSTHSPHFQLAFQHAVLTSSWPFSTQSALPVVLSTHSPYFQLAFQHAVRISSWPFSTQC
jgi:hypothetical protein